MTQMLIDKITGIALHSNVVRINCTAVGALGKEEAVGTILIPGNEVGPLMQALIKGLQDIEKQMRERVEQGAAPGPSGSPASGTAGNA
jgi:hypothetical protein